MNIQVQRTSHKRRLYNKKPSFSDSEKVLRHVPGQLHVVLYGDEGTPYAIKDRLQEQLRFYIDEGRQWKLCIAELATILKDSFDPN